MTYTRRDFADRVLTDLGAPNTIRNRRALQSWMQAEGNAGKFNPLNCTQWMPGSTDFNSVGVKNYDSFEDGVSATVHTLRYGAKHNQYGYGPIVRGLRKNRWASVVLAAVERSSWGTGGLALTVLPFVTVKLRSYEAHPIAQ